MELKCGDKVLVSACLLGEPCRYNGKYAKEKVRLPMGVQAILVCPEVLAGLPTPRPACEILDGRVIDENGIDYTDQFSLGAEKVLQIARDSGVNKAILKEKSPSCGSELAYDGTFTGTTIEGEGLTTRLLRQNGIEVVSEKDYSELF